MSEQNGNGELPSARVHPTERIYAMARRSSREHAERYPHTATRLKVKPEDRPTKDQSWQAWCSYAQANGQRLDREEFERWWTAEA